MVYQWVQGWTSHYETLKGLNLENRFNTQEFPVFGVTSNNYHEKKEFMAIYEFSKHKITFAKKWLNEPHFEFSYTFFHELMHSVGKHTGRFAFMWMLTNGNPEILQLEERIADVSATILCLASDNCDLDVVRILFMAIELNKTNLILPWGEVEESVLFYVKNKDCPKLKEKIQYVKQVIIDADLCPIHEGKFNGQVQTDIAAAV